MCTICMITQTFDPTRHLSEDPDKTSDQDRQSAVITEYSDAAEQASTIYTMSVGDTFRGTISTGFDEDWIAISLTQGEAYEISLTGLTLSDPYLRVFSSSGNLLASNDDAVGLDSRLTFTAGATGTYYIEADAYSNATGTYSLSVTETTAPQEPSDATYEEMADFLIEGPSGYSITFSAQQASAITVDISGLTATGQRMARWAMEAWEMVANVNFMIQNDGMQGNEMLTVDDEDAGAFAYYPNSGSTSMAMGDNTNGVEINVSRSWFNSQGTSLDSYSFQTFVHEFGHALGLHHQGDYNFNGQQISYANDATFADDSWILSVMSYFSPNENPTTDASYALSLIHI